VKRHWNDSWTMWLVVLLVSMLSLGLVGCGGDDDEEPQVVVVVVTNQVNGATTVVTNEVPAADPVVEVPAVVNVVGKWTGIMTHGGTNAHVEMTLTQTGNVVGGTYVLAGGASGKTAGTIDGDHLVVKMTPTIALSPDFYMTCDGHVNSSASQYLGNYRSNPSGVEGTFSLQK